MSRSKSQIPDDISEASSNALSRQDSFVSFTSKATANKQWESALRQVPDVVDNSASNRTPLTPNGSKLVKNPKSSKKTGNTAQQLAHHKVGRVKVGIRCRPAFQDELDFAQGNFFSIVDCKPSDYEQSSLGRVALTLLSGKQRDFLFDCIFDTSTTQDYVYDKIARPVVTDVLKGFNGTIFAYGQTGTGKTYTMGILEFVNNEHAGIIPRSIAQIFDYIEENSENIDVTVSLSFLQLYRETIQDLLGPINGGQVGDDNLLIREDPQRGFYVEGLQEFVVRNYSEAEALLNLGLENRAIAPTLMNATSSRSHTVLTLNIEQRGMLGDVPNSYGLSLNTTTTNSSHPLAYTRTIRSKLLMVDLAGSERVRRTVSKGTRLSEAKSINTSLSALGNVIAALAQTSPTVSHIPYRDSKLTRLLQDSLGGTASTALIATVGPAPVNYGETLSTLMFASRCMAVKSTPILHEEVDYAELCARLQEKIASLEGDFTSRMVEQQEKYEATIEELQLKLEKNANNIKPAVNIAVPTMSFDNAGLAVVFSHISSIALSIDDLNDVDSSNANGNWIYEILGSIGDDEYLKGCFQLLISLLAYCYELITSLTSDFTSLIAMNIQREEKHQEEMHEVSHVEETMHRLRVLETNKMKGEDPLNRILKSRNVKIGSHLAHLPAPEAIAKVQAKFKSNNEIPAPYDIKTILKKIQSAKVSFKDHVTTSTLVESFTQLHSLLVENLSHVSSLLVRKDNSFDTIKVELVDQLVERRKREEEVINWSYILKYLLGQSSKLRKQVREEKQNQIRGSSSTKKKSNEIMTESKESEDRSARNNNLKSVPNKTYDNDFIDQLSQIDDNDTFASSSSVHPVEELEEPSPLESVRRRMKNNEQSQNPGNRIVTLSDKSRRDHPKLGSRIAMTDEALLHNQASFQVFEVEKQKIDIQSQLSNSRHSVRSKNVISPIDHDQDRFSDADAETTPSVTGYSDIASSANLSFQSAATVTSIPLKVKKPPSLFAQGVVQELGVEGESAVAAMKIIDEVTKITPEQLKNLDSATRSQILQIRKDLGIDERLKLFSSKNASETRNLPMKSNLSSSNSFLGSSNSKALSNSASLNSKSPNNSRRSASAPRPTTPSNAYANNFSSQEDIRPSRLSQNGLNTVTPISLSGSIQEQDFRSRSRGNSSELIMADRAKLMSEAHRLQRNGGVAQSKKLHVEQQYHHQQQQQQEYQPHEGGMRGASSANNSNTTSRDRTGSSLSNVVSSSRSSRSHHSQQQQQQQREVFVEDVDDDDFSQLDEMEGNW